MKPFLLLTLLTGAALAAPAAAPLSAAPHQQDLQQVRQEIDSLKKDIAQKQAVKQEAQTAIQASEQALQQTSKTLASLEQKHSDSAQQLAELRTQIEASQAGLKAVRKRVALVLGNQYKASRHDAMRLMLNAGDPNQTSRDLTYYTYIARAQQQLVGDLIARQGELEAMSFQLEQELSRINSLSSQKEQEKDRIELNRQAHQQQLAALAGEIRERQSKLVKLQEDQQRLSGLIEQINREIERRRREQARKQAEARQAQQEKARKAAERQRQLAAEARRQGKPVPKEPVKPAPEQTVEAIADGSGSGKAFKSLQGRMRLPVSGSIAGRFGARRAEGTTWKGLFISAAPGQPVRSVADGQVVYADSLRGFGNAVIVDHGGNYLTVYTGLSAMSRNSGERVKAGETLGSTGTLDSGEAGLYFEIRYMGRPVNPQSWAP
ncbi:murein hydrolase activator EnvC [Pseudogulbenkiania sp. MAI-1]|uniref:murein hydrolase activator EnvC family protein n=1 Tax=Pseudogulbenkiania sp. MAI-1 TaxID=990370 RepID=UPI00045E8F14|nr:peptidoglycan DD-metalloendopeptidase family protein [Pseudogulbenkiania sp. MAI-1]